MSFMDAAQQPPTISHGGRSQDVATRLSDVEKAAIILSVLGPKVAATLLDGFDHQKIQRFAHAVTDMQQVSAETVEETIVEFLEHLKVDGGITGGVEETRKFLDEFMEKDQVNQLMEDVEAKGRSVWIALNDVADERILSWLKTEHPQVAAITLTKLTAAKTARLLEQLDSETANRLILRMNQATTASAEVTKRIGEIIRQEFLPTAKVKKGRKDPPELIASVMNHVSSGVRDQLLQHMEEKTPALAKDVRKFVFTYEDIPTRINGRDISQVIKAVDESSLLIALSSTGEAATATSEFILSNISSRLASRLRDDIKEMPKPKQKEFESAQGIVVAEIVNLRDQGIIKMIDTDAIDE